MICARTDSHQLKPFVPVILSSAPPNSTQLLPHTTMANHLYGQHQQKLPSSIYSAAKSAVDSTYLTDSSSSRLPSSSRYYSSSFSDSDRTPSTYLSSADAASTALWPSFDVSSIYTKRPTQAIYTQSSLGAHMLGQSEAWLSSDSLAKRPKLENACNLPVYPQRPGEKDCAHYMLTRTCRFGDSCKFDHPIWVPDGGIPDWKEMQLPPIPSEAHPERPGELDCPYFLKTQKCKFGLNCKFNHPKDKLSTLGKTDVADLPERPAEPLCSFYVKTGKCKFGTVCKFHHPKDIQIPSDGLEATNSEQAKSAGIGTLPSDRNFISDPTPSFNSKGLPIRLGEEDCPFYMKTGSCKYAANCRYNHPDRNAINPPAVVVGHSVLPSPIHNMTVGLVNPAAILQSFQPSLAQTTFGPGQVLYPQRPGQNECEYYIKTGICKFGEKCRFHHPVDRSSSKSVKLTLAGLPRREGVLNCPFYMKTGTCRYGATCRFDHPTPGEVIASAGREGSAAAEEEKEDGENTESSEE